MIFEFFIWFKIANINTFQVFSGNFINLQATKMQECLCRQILWNVIFVTTIEINEYFKNFGSEFTQCILLTKPVTWIRGIARHLGSKFRVH
jgi:hypothetical protein